MEFTSEGARAQSAIDDALTVIWTAARTAWALAWADSEERAGRSLSGAKLEESAPERVPEQFIVWAGDAATAALGAAMSAGPQVWGAWIAAEPAELGRAIALSVGGWTDGFGEAGIPCPAELPNMDCDPRLHWEGGAP